MAADDSVSTRLEQAVRSAFGQAGLGERLFFAVDAPYQSAQGSYFSNQERCLEPLGVVQPCTADEVAQTVKILRQLRQSLGDEHAVKFAVRSGGHCVWPGAANIDGGITIDLRHLNHVSVRHQRSEVDVGAGAVWGDVYSVLSQSDITVAGGRVADVGVGGLTLGGGISFFSPRVGFVCDNVVAYEIVLADGALEQVTRDSHPELWWALKGGGSNFGIVTRFTMRSFPSGDVYGGCFLYPMSTAQGHIKAFHDYAAGPCDERAGAISVYSFRAGQGRHVFNTLTYTEPTEKPAALAGFLGVAEPLYSTGRVTSQHDLTVEQTKLSSDNFQNCYMTTTVAADLGTLRAAFGIWEASVSEVEAVPGVCWALGFQVLHPATTRRSAALGGNPMGLGEAPPLVIVLITNFWERASDNETLVGRTARLVAEIEAEAARRGTYQPFKYLNYAWSGQDVFAGYGADNRARLQQVARRYDPDGVFQKMMPGGFKVF